jgi:hypothetical protein
VEQLELLIIIWTRKNLLLEYAKGVKGLLLKLARRKAVFWRGHQKSKAWPIWISRVLHCRSLERKKEGNGELAWLCLHLERGDNCKTLHSTLSPTGVPNPNSPPRGAIPLDSPRWCRHLLERFRVGRQEERSGDAPYPCHCNQSPRLPCTIKVKRLIY